MGSDGASTLAGNPIRSSCCPNLEPFFVHACAFAMLLLALLPPGDLYLGKVIGQIAGATVNMVLIIRIVVGA